MLAATTAPAAAYGPQILAALITFAAVLLGALAATVGSYFAIRAAYRHQIIAERRLDAYLRLNRLLAAAGARVDNWPHWADEMHEAVRKAREHCAIHMVLLDAIAIDFMRFYDDHFEPWYKGKNGTAPAKQVPIPPMPEMGRFTPGSAAQACTMFKAIGLTAGPQYPPCVLFPSTLGSGTNESRSTWVMLLMVLISEIASAPAFRAARAG